MKKTVTTVLLTLGVVAIIGGAFAFTKASDKPAEGGEFMTITTVESIIPGGLGRSRMFITDPSGKLEERKMKNFYSMVGINMGNINENDAAILNTLNAYTKEGWKVMHVNTGVQSPSSDPNGGKGEGIYMTRYLLKK